MPQIECSLIGMEPGAVASIKPQMSKSGIYFSKCVPCEQTNTLFDLAVCGKTGNLE